MNTFFSADYVLPVTGRAVKNGVVELTNRGVVVDVYEPDEPKLSNKEITTYHGIITPGFVNAHCHLELSHMAGTIAKHTGLVPFLQQVMSLRAATAEKVERAMRAADKQLYDNGVVAVGDHANTSISATVKAISKIHYHTFVETLGFEPELAEQRLSESRTIARQFKAGSVSLTAHAPYSVSKELFKQINEEATQQATSLSIHNQESEEENKFFRYKSGDFVAFYDALGKDITGFKAQARNSLQTFISYLDRDVPVLLVHNTYTAPKDVFYVERQQRNVTWCFCPNANLYIEGVLPKVKNFIQYNHRITLGTDSLASNERLCILSELKTIHRHFPDLPLAETMKWATINGANFLGISEKYGSLERGKIPGLNLLEHTKGLGITADTTVRRLV